MRIAKDVAEAVGYLHHRNIVPTAKSLRSANVFIEGGKAVFNHCQVNVNSGLVAAWRRVNAASSLYNKRPPRCTTSDLTQPKGWLQG